MGIEDIKEIIDDLIAYNNFSESVTILNETKQGTSSIYDVQNAAGKTFYAVPGFAGLAGTAVMGFIKGDRQRPQLVGGAAATSNSQVTVIVDWGIPVDTTPGPSITTVLFGGGGTNDATNIIDSIQIFSLGNAADFGDLSVTRTFLASTSSATLALFAGGFLTPSFVGQDVIDYVTIASTGNATDFGNLTAGKTELTGVSDGTSALFAGGLDEDLGIKVTNIDKVTIASTGNATSWGVLSVGRLGLAACSGGGRGVYAGGDPEVGGARTDTIDYTTIATNMTALSFGVLTDDRLSIAAASNGTLGLFIAGRESIGDVKKIDKVTIASTGNAVGWGNLTTETEALAAAGNSTRGIYGGGDNTGGIDTDVIEYSTISIEMTALTFGTLSVGRGFLGACSGS